MPDILVVNDEPQLLATLQELLALHGYDVTTAESGAEALKQVVNSPPDLIIADVTMRDTDGHEFLRRARTLTGARVPLLLLASQSGLTERLASLGEGADGYVTKPLHPQELVTRISTILTRVEQTRARERADLDAFRSQTLARLTARLRDPVQALARELDDLSSERLGGNPDAQRVHLRRAIEYAHILCELVDDLQWASADDLDQGLSWETVRIAPIVRRSAASASRQAAAKNVRMNITCGGLLSGVLNEAAIIRALTKLLEAVVAMAPTGGQVSIMARRAQDQGLEFVITEDSLCSNGHSAAEGLRDALDRARHVVRAHHGKLDVQQTRDGRQSYVLWLPGRAHRTGRAA